MTKAHRERYWWTYLAYVGEEHEDMFLPPPGERNPAPVYFGLVLPPARVTVPTKCEPIGPIGERLTYRLHRFTGPPGWAFWSDRELLAELRQVWENREDA